MKRVSYFILMTAFATLAACGVFGTKNFNETESGIKYYFHVKTNNEKPEIGNTLKVNMIYSIEDSVLFDNVAMDIPSYIDLLESQYEGDIFEALSMMSVGDSATFVLDATSFYLYTAGLHTTPPFVKEDSEIVFHIKILKSMDEEAYALEEQKMMEEEIAKQMLLAEQEEEVMLDYLAREGITQKPTSTGLYYIENERGDGPKVEAGQLVSVHYEGRLIDGTVFDSSHNRGEPIEFVVGQGWVIPGWDEGITMMHIGGKATLVIPSHLAYGDRAPSPLIPPFSTLIFDVEVVDATDQ